MRYLILSDIHGNWQALSSVLQAASGDAVERILVLGDLVGAWDEAASRHGVERIKTFRVYEMDV